MTPPPLSRAEIMSLAYQQINEIIELWTDKEYTDSGALLRITMVCETTQREVFK